MKNILIASMLIFAISCGEKNSDTLTAKKDELQQLEVQLSDTKAKILKLKTEIEELDTSARSNAIAIRAMEIKSGTYKNPFQIQGLVESDQNIMVNAEVPAKILDIRVKEGQYVSKGQLLATLDGAIASSQISELENALTLAKTNYEKQERLWNQNIGSEMQYLQAKNNYENLQKSIETAKQQLGKYTITAPISGTVDAIMGKEGQLTGGAAGALMRIVNLADMKIVANVSESYVGKMTKGQAVELYFPSIDLKLHEKISAVGNVIDVNNRTFKLYVEPTSNLKKLKPNMLGMITAYDYVQDNVISVPTRLVRNDGEKAFIYAVKANGKKLIVEKRFIELGQQFPTSSIILSGLNPGDIIISEGANNVIVGDEVKIIED